MSVGPGAPPGRTGSGDPTDPLRAAAAGAPDHQAVAHGAKGATYGWLDAVADGFAATLLGLDVRPGDRVALLLPDSIKLIGCVFGAVRAGAVAVPVDLGPDPPARDAVATAAAPAIIVVGDGATAPPGVAPGRVLAVTALKAAFAAPPPAAFPAVGPDDPAVALADPDPGPRPDGRPALITLTRGALAHAGRPVPGRTALRAAIARPDGLALLVGVLRGRGTLVLPAGPG